MKEKERKKVSSRARDLLWGGLCGKNSHALNSGGGEIKERAESQFNVSLFEKSACCIWVSDETMSLAC